MIFVFPGQGSQKIGMGKDIYDSFSSARNVFHEVDDAISFKLSKKFSNVFLISGTVFGTCLGRKTKYGFASATKRSVL